MQRNEQTGMDELIDRFTFNDQIKRIECSFLTFLFVVIFSIFVK